MNNGAAHRFTTLNVPKRVEVTTARNCSDVISRAGAFCICAAALTSPLAGPSASMISNAAVDGRVVGGVAAHGHNPTRCRGGQLRRFFERGDPPSEREHGDAGLGQGQRYGAADARAGPGDDDPFVRDVKIGQLTHGVTRSGG